MKVLKFMSVALLMLSVACSNEKESNVAASDKTMKFESFSYDVVAQDSAGSGKSALWHNIGRGVLPLSIGDADISLLRDSLIRLTQVELSSSGDASPRLGNGVRVIDKDPSKTETGNFTTNELYVVLNTGSIIVWQNHFEGYAYGAAHGIHSNSYVNYSVVDKKIISLTDIFKPGYEKTLTQMLREKLSDNKNLLVPTDEVQIPHQFRITSDGIDFVYGIYEIAPYSSGEIVVNLYAYELQDLLTPAAFKMIAGQTY